MRGLAPADFQVEVAGKSAEIVSVKPATTPMRIAILDSDGGTGAFQLGVLRFMQRLDGYAEFSLVSIIVQPIKLIDYSTDGPSLSKALEALGRRGNERGGQLLEAINETIGTIRSAGKRSVIAVLRIGGEEADSSLDPELMRERLRKSGAILDVIGVRGASQSTAAPMGSQTGVGRQHLYSVLNDGSRESGGHFDEAPPLEISKAVAALADDLLNQYAVTYAAPWAKPGDKLAVSTTRKGVDVFAPNYVAF
jgi:hypothetical protein